MNDLNTDQSISKGKLTGMVMSRFIPGILILFIMLFLPAGTLKYWNAWIFMGELLIPMIGILAYFMARDPSLLQKRLIVREKEKTQKKFVQVNLLVFLSVFIICGLDYRFHWSEVPLWLVILSALFVLSGYLLFFAVMRQNTYASRVIEIQDKQKVIDTGLYAMVRHPMYLAAISMYFFMPLVLGSFYGFVVMLLFPAQINIRIKNEEEILEKGLEGYLDYKKKVKYKIIPFIW
jgi:protein-S-isoprenylcysteine O-methyltransferase Ste14